MSGWQERHVVVLGGSQGLGLSIASSWLKRGASVTLVARNETKLQAARTQLLADGDVKDDAVNVIPADVTNSDDVQRLFRTFETVDVLVNAFGKSDRGRAIETTTETYEELMQLNFLAVTRCVSASIEHLRKSQGSIVNIGSLASKSASPFLGAYPSSKFALAAYSAQLRMELAEENIHVLLVCPGPIRRDDSGERYQDATADVPAAAKKPGGGVKVGLIEPQWLANKIIDACEQKRAELIIPSKSKLLFAIAQLSPRLGDWIVKRMTS